MAATAHFGIAAVVNSANNCTDAAMASFQDQVRLALALCALVFLLQRL